MKLAVSNIAWDVHNDPIVLSKLKELNVTGIEIAPTKIWPGWNNISLSSAKKYKEDMKELGFEIPAMQALLFGLPNLQLFKKGCHEEFLKHFTTLATIAAGLGAKSLVFGSPKNRIKGPLDKSTADSMAKDFFLKAAQICHDHDCSICIEHNPIEYSCDYLTDAKSVKNFVESVNHPGLKIHLDSAGMVMSGDSPSTVLDEIRNFAHFHISEPMLNPIYRGQINHIDYLDKLKDLNYDGWVSIEMKTPDTNEKLIKSVEEISTIIF